MVELTEDDLSIFSNFEKITHVMPSDYVLADSLMVFLVNMSLLGKAIGKKGANIEKLKTLFRKRVVIAADSEDLELFIRCFFNNIEIRNIEIRNVMGVSEVMLTVEEKDRGIAIGREGERIKIAKTLLKKKFNANIHVKTSR